MSSKMSLSRLSFRWQVTLLGGLVVVLFVAVSFAGLAASRYTKSAVLASEKRSLLETASELAREYSDREDSARDVHEALLLEDPSLESSRQHLTQISHAVVQKLDAVEGGFYSAANDSLVGVSSSSDMSADESQQRDVTPAEQSAILKVARSVTLAHRPGGEALTSLSNIALMEAVPIVHGSDYVGCSWTLKRFSTLPGANRFRTYLIAVGLGLAALISVLLTLFVLRNLQTGVLKIEEGLEALEHNLASQISSSADPDEIRRIARAINRLGATLRENIEKERQIEGRLRHAERLAALGRLIAGVAHEVRNPLATIRLRVQMCQDSGDPHVRKSCAIALEEIERLNNMVNRLLSFSRPVRLQSEPIDLDQLVGQRLERFSEAAHRHDIRVVKKSSRGFAAVCLDQERMAQVFDNVIQNAIDAMADHGGTLCVNVTREATQMGNGPGACVEFNDTGEGISPDVLGRIFDPFFTTKASGTGLGLSICHELIQAHGGDIKIVSAAGCGTTVRILLPLIDGQTSGQLV